MSSIDKKKTVNFPNQWKENGKTYRGEASYGMIYLSGNPEPYFSITGATYYQYRNTWREDSGGCLHNVIKEKAPNLAPLIPYHLFSQSGIPLYYLENGYYWYQHDLGIFRDYVLVEETEELPISTEKEVIIDWLDSRLPKIQQQFEEVMRRFNVEFITSEEIEELQKR